MTDKMYREFGRRLKAIRLRRGMRQEDLAKRLRLSRTSVVNIEAGRHGVAVHHLVRLVSVLRTRYGDLLP